MAQQGPTTNLDRIDVLNAMWQYGGGFVRALSEAWRLADHENDAKLRAAFGHYWDQYAAMAAQDLERRGAR